MHGKHRIWPCITQGSGTVRVNSLHAPSVGENAAPPPVCAVKRHKCRAPIALLALLLASSAAFAKKPFFSDRAPKSAPTNSVSAGTNSAAGTNAESAASEATTNEPPPAAAAD